jgi:hypothetical protein
VSHKAATGGRGKKKKKKKKKVSGTFFLIAPAVDRVRPKKVPDTFSSP